MSPQDGAEAQGTQVRQTPHRLDPSLTMLVHMPRAPDVNTVSVEGGATTEPLTLFIHPHRYPRAARPSLLPPAARIGALYFFCRVLAQRAA